MRFTLPIVLFCTLATPVFAQSMTEKSGVNSMVGTAPSTQDFVTEAAQSDMFEIQSSRLASAQGTGKPVKEFATQMISAHQKTTDQLKSLISKGKVKAKPPSALNSSQQSMLDKLKSLHGADFDKQYVTDQVDGHKQAVDLFTRYSKGGNNPALKQWTAATLPTIQHHLDMANGLNS